MKTILFILAFAVTLIGSPAQAQDSTKARIDTINTLAEPICQNPKLPFSFKIHPTTYNTKAILEAHPDWTNEQIANLTCYNFTQGISNEDLEIVFGVPKSGWKRGMFKAKLIAQTEVAGHISTMLTYDFAFSPDYRVFFHFIDNKLEATSVVQSASRYR